MRHRCPECDEPVEEHHEFCPGCGADLYESYDPDQEPMPWAETQGDLGYILNLLGEKRYNTRYLEEAAEAYEAVSRIYEEGDMEKDANFFADKSRAVNNLMKQLKSG